MKDTTIPQCVIDFATEKKQHAEKLRNKIILNNKFKTGCSIWTYCIDNYYFVNMINKDSKNYLFIKEEYWVDDDESIEQEFIEYRFYEYKEKNFPPIFKLYEIRVYDNDERLHNLFGPSILNFDLRSGGIARAAFYIDEQIYPVEQFAYKSRKELREQGTILHNDGILALRDSNIILENIIKRRFNKLNFKK